MLKPRFMSKKGANRNPLFPPRDQAKLRGLESDDRQGTWMSLTPPEARTPFRPQDEEIWRQLKYRKGSECPC